ncbi:hypothetical protein BGZ92_007718 [Podila epicladia]|nr:hypothetical protein BGZ92_007718 [Podila epicladia]
MSTPIKLTFGNAKANKPVLAKKAVAAFASNDTHEPAKKDEFISGIDGNKITSLVPKEESKLLVIPKQENADWRSKSLEKRKKQYMPEESVRSPMEIIEEPVMEVGYGLQITKRVKVEHVPQEETASEPVVEQVTAASIVIEKEETIDELAARKIMEDLDGHSPEARKLVLEGQENIHADDVEAFQKNLEELPDEATLEDYDKVPVEEFGAALLRGMGWNGDAKGSEAIEFNRRPALLGLGAKPKEPEPITKKYIKPGESRTPQAISVPTSHTTGRSSASSSRDRDNRREYSNIQDKHRDDRESRQTSETDLEAVGVSGTATEIETDPSVAATTATTETETGTHGGIVSETFAMDESSLIKYRKSAERKTVTTSGGLASTLSDWHCSQPRFPQ